MEFFRHRKVYQIYKRQKWARQNWGEQLWADLSADSLSDGIDQYIYELRKLPKWV